MFRILLLLFRQEDFIPFREKDNSLSALPMVHVAGLVIGMLNPLSQGATVVTLPRFQPKHYLDALQKYKVLYNDCQQFSLNIQLH